MKRTLESNGALQNAASSREAQSLLRSVDAEAMEAAATRGDTAALKRMLSGILATPEGKALAQKVQRAVKDNG